MWWRVKSWIEWPGLTNMLAHHRSDDAVAWTNLESPYTVFLYSFPCVPSRICFVATMWLSFRNLAK